LRNYFCAKIIISKYSKAYLIDLFFALRILKQKFLKIDKSAAENKRGMLLLKKSIIFTAPPEYFLYIRGKYKKLKEREVSA
jgi:hypothetical protein